MKIFITVVLTALLLTGCARSNNRGEDRPLNSQDMSRDLPVSTVPELTDIPETSSLETSSDTEASSEASATPVTTTVTTVTTSETTSETTTVVTTVETTVTTTEKTTATTTEAPATTTAEPTTVTETTPETTVSEAQPADLMDNIEIMKTCPSSATDRRSGITYPSYVHKTYSSKTTGLTRGVNILLPAGYDSQKKYPVLYVLHGIFGDEYTLPNDSVMAFSEISTNLAADGLAKEMIIVFPNIYASSDPNQQPSFGDSSSIPPYDNFINDLVNDLMPYIESNYSVLTGRENTAIAGFSMGGREAMFIEFSRPDLFAYCGAFSPAPGLTPGKDWAFDHPGQLTESELTFDGKEYSPELFLICCGTKDGTVGSFPKSYHEIMERNKTKHVWYEIPDADHDGYAVKSGFNNFIRNIF